MSLGTRLITLFNTIAPAKASDHCRSLSILGQLLSPALTPGHRSEDLAFVSALAMILGNSRMPHPRDFKFSLTACELQRYPKIYDLADIIHGFHNAVASTA